MRGQRHITSGWIYTVDYAGSATVHRYDIILVSLTSDCDFWTFIAERVGWVKGSYKVIVGGAGVLNVRPFLPYADYFVLGRAEHVIDKLIDGLAKNRPFDSESVIDSSRFNADKSYAINQVSCTYPEILLDNGRVYKESSIGCPHRCHFCGYTWQRKTVKADAFAYGDLWTKNKDVERAMIDISRGVPVDLNKLRTTAIDGLSERIRFAVNKRISREMLREFLRRLALCEKPHQVKIYNIIGYPTEDEADRQEFVEDIAIADRDLPQTEKQTSLLLHSTPFRAMPATPLACAPMQYRNFRGVMGRLNRDLKGGIFYQGHTLWAVESQGTESLPTVILSAIVWRGTENDTDNVKRIACSSAFWRASGAVKQATLEKYFDTVKYFAAYTAETLPTKYLKTYTSVNKLYGKTKLEAHKPAES